MIKKIFLPLCIIFLTALPLNAQADKQARRAMPRFSYSVTNRLPNHIHAKVTNLTFQRAGANRGIWKGLVQGNGNISLYLNVFKNGVLYYSRFIGRLHQSENEKPTPFKYISAVPTNTRWSWKITVKVK